MNQKTALSSSSRQNSVKLPSSSNPTFTNPSDWNVMLQRRPVEQSYHKGGKMVFGIQSLSCPNPSLKQSKTTTSMTENCWPSSKPWKNGDITLKVHPILSKSSLTTKTLKSSRKHANCPEDKQDGPCIFPDSTSRSPIHLARMQGNWTPSQDDQIMRKVTMTMKTASFYQIPFLQNNSPLKLSIHNSSSTSRIANSSMTKS